MVEQRKPSLKVIWRLLKHIKPYRGKAVLLYVLLYTGLSFDLMRPVVVAWAIDHITLMVRTGADVGQVWPLTVCYVLLFFGLSILRDVLRFRRGLTQTAIAHGVMSDLRCLQYEKVQRLSLKYHGNTPSGELIARFVTGGYLTKVTSCSFHATLPWIALTPKHGTSVAVWDYKANTLVGTVDVLSILKAQLSSVVPSGEWTESLCGQPHTLVFLDRPHLRWTFEQNRSQRFDPAALPEF